MATVQKIEEQFVSGSKLVGVLQHLEARLVQSGGSGSGFGSGFGSDVGSDFGRDFGSDFGSDFGRDFGGRVDRAREFARVNEAVEFAVWTIYCSA